MSFQNYGAIFDMDGVLADTAEPHFRSWQATAELVGVRMSREFFDEMFGHSNYEIVPRWLSRSVSREECDRIAGVKEARYRQIVSDSIRPVPGVVELITQMRAQGWKLALGSSGPPENIELILRALKIDGCFDVTISGSDVAKGKPDPETFLEAARRMRLEPSDCVVFEDSPVCIKTAGAAGMACVALATTHDSTALQDADRVLVDLRAFTPQDAADIIAARRGDG